MVACLSVAACGGEPPAPDLVPVQGFRLEVHSNGSPTAVRDEARHRLYFQPLDEVLDGWQFKSRDEGVVVELVSSDGKVLESHPVYSLDLCVDPGGCFTEWRTVFEHPPDYAAFRFVEGSQIVYEEYRSPNAPEVSIQGLEQGQAFAADADFVFRVLIDDKDGDALQARVLLSVDGGPYLRNYPGSFTEYGLLDLTVEDHGSPVTMTSGVNVPGVARIVPAGSQSVRLLVFVTDGSRVAAAESPEFTLEPIAAVPPHLQIRRVQDGEIIGPHVPFDISAWVLQLVLFGDELVEHNSIHPRLDGEQAVTWISDKDGDITEHVTPRGPGGRIEADALTPGTHVLKAIFVGDSGLQASDSVIVTILGPDDPIGAVDDHLVIGVGETLEHAVTDNDVETSRRIDIDTLEIVEPPEVGTAAVVEVVNQSGAEERVIQFTPHYVKINEDDHLEDSLTYQICDRGPDPRCSTARMRMTIYPSGYPYWAYE